jgi:hypothetical protein
MSDRFQFLYMKGDETADNNIRDRLHAAFKIKEAKTPEQRLENDVYEYKSDKIEDVDRYFRFTFVREALDKVEVTISKHLQRFDMKNADDFIDENTIGIADGLGTPPQREFAPSTFLLCNKEKAAMKFHFIGRIESIEEDWQALIDAMLRFRPGLFNAQQLEILRKPRALGKNPGYVSLPAVIAGNAKPSDAMILQLCQSESYSHEWGCFGYPLPAVCNDKDTAIRTKAMEQEDIKIDTTVIPKNAVAELHKSCSNPYNEDSLSSNVIHSPKYRLLYVDIVKSGSTSIKKQLDRALGLNWEKTLQSGIYRTEQLKNPEHYFRFSWVRSPDTKFEAGVRERWKSRPEEMSNFTGNDMLDLQLEEPVHSIKWLDHHYQSTLYRLAGRDASGALMDYHFIGRLEHINEDWQAMIDAYEKYGFGKLISERQMKYLRQEMPQENTRKNLFKDGEAEVAYNRSLLSKEAVLKMYGSEIYGHEWKCLGYPPPEP